MDGLLRLNIKESSLRKKRGTSFFEGRDPDTFNELALVAESGDVHDEKNMESNRTSNNLNVQKDPFRGYQSVKIS